MQLAITFCVVGGIALVLLLVELLRRSRARRRTGDASRSTLSRIWVGLLAVLIALGVVGAASLIVLASERVVGS